MNYFSREDQIISICKGKKILHIGCVGFTDSDSQTRIDQAKNSLHWRLSRIADVVGLDYSMDVIEELKNNGVFDNILYANAEKLEELILDKKFEIIVAGDIIEHLANPGLMLDGLKKFCTEDTEIVITTPNAFGLLNFFRFLLNRFLEGQEHVMSYNSQNIRNLLERYNFRINELDTCYQNHAKKYSIFFYIGKYFFQFVPKFGGTLFIVAKYCK